MRSESQAAASAAARHGLSTVQTLPKRTLSNGRPSQKTTKTKRGEMFSCGETSPIAAATRTSTKSAKETAPATIRRPLLRRKPARPAGSGLPWLARASSGCFQSAYSATNETMRTSAAP